MLNRVDVKDVMSIKALLTARDILLEELLKLSEAVNQAIDLTEFLSQGSDMKFLNPILRANQVATDIDKASHEMVLRSLFPFHVV